MHVFNAMVYVAMVTAIVGVIMRVVLTAEEPEAKTRVPGRRRIRRRRSAAAKA